MSIKRITAIVPIDLLIPMEKYLRACDVPGVTVEHVKGYGEHPNFYRRDLMQENVRILLYADEEKVDAIVDAMMKCSKNQGAMAGILSVESIDRLVSLKDGTDVSGESL